MNDPKLVLVTGATRGLGYALAIEAAKRGAHVIALGRTEGALDELADAIDACSGAITQVPMDITDDHAIAYLGKSIYERWGKLDYWLHTAWFTAPMQPVPHLLAKDLDQALKTNIRATARLIAMLEPIMRATKGARAVFFDDQAFEGPHLANIAATKKAQIAIANSWAEESKKIGPAVDIQRPQPMRGHLRATLYPGEDRNALANPIDEAASILDIVITP